METTTDHFVNMRLINPGIQAAVCWKCSLWGENRQTWFVAFAGFLGVDGRPVLMASGHHDMAEGLLGERRTLGSGELDVPLLLCPEGGFHGQRRSGR